MIGSDDNRPSPDALLDQAQRERRGKLKIFIGAAPGVGKTYSMLRAAQARKKEGVDIVVGIVETHQRSETDAMVIGLENIPRLNLDYRGVAFQEMDLDGILARAPALVLVDELAHSNIPGARHAKRYRDVEEILDHGIDVYSTLNVQHIESLNDIVTRITGITVRETVPDSILQQADSIELIDLTPEELLQRLKDGKIYIPEQARLAMSRFFTPGNLTALRELALRHAAARVDEQMTSYMRQHAITGPWPASDRILVCISEDGQAVPLIRTAKRSAERRQSAWITMYIQTHRYALMPEESRQAVTQAMHLAESLGAETLTVTGENIAEEVLRIARERNVSIIIIGKSKRSIWSRLTRPSVAATIMQQGDSFDILVMSQRAEANPSENSHQTAKKAASPLPRFAWMDLLKSFSVVGIATAIGFIIRDVVDPATMALLYLIAILLVSVDRGFLVSALASGLSFVLFDFLFVTPRYSLVISRSEDFVMLCFYLVVSLAIAWIGDRLKRQIVVTRRNAERTQALYDFNKSIAATSTLDEVTKTIVAHVAASLNARVALFLPQASGLAIAASYPSDLRLDTASKAAIEWSWRHNRPAGLHTDTLPSVSFLGMPLKLSEGNAGVLAIQPEDARSLTPDQENFLSSLLTQSAMTIERTRLSSDVAMARLQAETEKLHASLLASVSHDLRTPLTTILGATASLHQGWDRFDDKSRLGLVVVVEDEANRLNHFVQNLLDMTQLTSGDLKLRRRPIEVKELIENTLLKFGKQASAFMLSLEIADHLPPIYGDAGILEQVLYNIIDNARKFSHADEMLKIRAEVEGDFIRLAVIDWGPGIPPEERERVFDMFYRVKVGTETAGGAGLGLAISRGFIEAHHGRIAAMAGEHGVGTQIVVWLPILKDGMATDATP